VSNQNPDAGLATGATVIFNDPELNCSVEINLHIRPVATV